VSVHTHVGTHVGSINVTLTLTGAVGKTSAFYMQQKVLADKQVLFVGILV
jgi:hypothetical protein